VVACDRCAEPTTADPFDHSHPLLHHHPRHRPLRRLGHAPCGSLGAPCLPTAAQSPLLDASAAAAPAAVAPPLERDGRGSHCPREGAAADRPRWVVFCSQHCRHCPRPPFCPRAQTPRPCLVAWTAHRRLEVAVARARQQRRLAGWRPQEFAAQQTLNQGSLCNTWPWQTATCWSSRAPGPLQLCSL
jgi:hypothetical protein